MSMPKPTEGRATLARSYRNLSEREIHAKLEGAMSDAERVTAKAELLRRNSGNNEKLEVSRSYTHLFKGM